MTPITEAMLARECRFGIHTLRDVHVLTETPRALTELRPHAYGRTLLYGHRMFRTRILVLLQRLRPGLLPAWMPLLLWSAIFAPPEVRADDLRVLITANQTVTMAGRATSLKAVVSDLCYRTGVDLVFYDAEDRAFGGTYESLPLSLLLARLLRDESYLAESVEDPSTGQPRITTLRVLGDPLVASARRSRGGGRLRHFEVPPALLETAFGQTATDDAERDAALTAMTSRISSDPAQLQGFLGTDPALIAQAIRRYKGVEQPLREMKARYPDPRIAGKIDEILAALANPSTGR